MNQIKIQTPNIGNKMWVFLALSLSIIAGLSRIDPGSPVPLILLSGNIGFVAYRRFGLVAILILLAFSTWYPVGVGPIAKLLPILTDQQSLVGLVVLVFGVLSIANHLVNPKRKISLRVPLIVLTLTIIGWSFTLLEAPISQTFLPFRQHVYYMLLFILCLLYINTPKQAELICWATVISETISVIIIFIGYYVTSLPFFFIPSDQLEIVTGRLQGGYKLPGAIEVRTWAPRLSGVIASIYSLPVTYWLGKLSKRFISLLLLILLAFLGIALLRTGGRGGWLAVTVSIILIWIIGVIYKIVKPIVAVLLIGVPVILIYVMVAVFLVGDFEFLERSRSMLALTQEINLVARMNILRDGLQIWLHHPLGIGFLSLQTKYLGIFEHNVLLVLLNGVGPLGLFAYLWLWAWIGIRSIRTVRFHNGRGRLVGMAAIGSLVAALVSGFSENVPFLTPSIWIFWGASVAISYYVPRGNSIQSKSL